MTSELRASEFIDEYVSAGPKIYAYKIVDSATGERKTVCKVRGITLNYNASHLVNFEVIKDMILGKKPRGSKLLYTQKTRSSVRGRQ